MNQNLKYLVENILDDFYADEQSDIIGDFLGYKYFPKDKDELQKIIKEHYKNNIFNLNDIDVSQITDFSYLFYDDKHTGHKDFDVSYWDVSNGVDFGLMFAKCTEFNSDLSQWNVSKGKDFTKMFAFCRNFNSDLSQWDVSEGIYFSEMFYACNIFNSNLSTWDVSKGATFNSMFAGCKVFNSDLSKWDVSEGMDFSYMFQGCFRFNSDLSKWNISIYVKNNIYKYQGMFKYCDNLNNNFIPKDISGWIVRNN